MSEPSDRWQNSFNVAAISSGVAPPKRSRTNDSPRLTAADWKPPPVDRAPVPTVRVDRIDRVADATRWDHPPHGSPPDRLSALGLPAQGGGPRLRRLSVLHPGIRTLDALELDPAVTFLVGPNGSGKSTLVEAIAVAAGFNPEGGSHSFNFSTRSSHSVLHGHTRLTRGVRRPRRGYFLRAESFFNVASAIDRLEEEQAGLLAAYGGCSLHEQSHGEAFLALATNRFGPDGLYILDEPEAALSVPGNLALLKEMHDLTAQGAQFIVATHSPILTGYPGALIYSLDDQGFQPTAWDDTEHYRLTRSFLEDRERFFRQLFGGT